MTKAGDELTWKELEIGLIITEPGNASEYRTGDWRTQKPTFIFCPEGCIEPNEEGYFEANPFYCKGCGICARECWTKAITMVEEE